MADHEQVPPIVHALSGAVASIFSNSFVYPLDLVTTRLQTQEKAHKRSRRASGTPLTHDKHYDGLRHALLTIYEEEGASNLWQGVWADNVSTMASTFCYHFAYNFIRDARFRVAARKNGGKKPPVLGMLEELSIGAGAGVIARFMTSPLSNVVTRSQTQGGSTKDIIRAIYKEKGFTGFWSGMKASVMLAANPSISYYLFELQKALLIPKSRRSSPRAIEIFLMSANGKAIATLLLYPIILVKARTQAMRAKAGIWQIIKGILEKDGLAGLYEGAVPQVLKGFLSQGILMLLKDRIATLIISAYLAISKNKGKIANSEFYFSDAPKTDVNGLIAATKDRVEVAVDQAIEQVKDAAGNVAESVHLDEAVDGAKDMVQSARQATGFDNAVSKANELAGSVMSQAGDLAGNVAATATQSTVSIASKASDFVGSATNKAGEAASNAVNTARDLAGNAADKASELADSAASKVGELTASANSKVKASSG